MASIPESSRPGSSSARGSKRIDTTDTGSSEVFKFSLPTEALTSDGDGDGDGGVDNNRKEQEDATTEDIIVTKLSQVENTDGKIPDLIIIVSLSGVTASGIGAAAYALDISDLTMHRLAIFKTEGNYLDMGFATSGSKLYALEGSEFFICDLSNWKKKKNNMKNNDDKVDDALLKWEKGPQLTGRKPTPVVVALRGKLYALAGSPIRASPWEKISDPFFEVFDTNVPQSEWESLPNPPFHDLYFCNHDLFMVHSHAVIRDTIYVRLSCSTTGISIYAYNVCDRGWKHIKDDCGNEEDLVVDNLRECQWGPWAAEIADNKIFHCRTKYHGSVEVYAYDLAAAKPEPIAKDIKSNGIPSLNSDGATATNYEGGDDGSSNPIAKDLKSDGIPSLNCDDATATNYEEGDDGSSSLTVSKIDSADFILWLNSDVANATDYEEGDDGSSSLTVSEIDSADFTLWLNSDVANATDYEEGDEGSAIDKDIESNDGASTVTSEDDATPHQGPCVTLPVLGLEDVTDSIRRFVGGNGFLAHLVGNMFCLVYFFYPKRELQRDVIICTFHLVEKEGKSIFPGSAEVPPQPRQRTLQAEISQKSCSTMPTDVYIPSQWGKIYCYD